MDRAAVTDFDPTEIAKELGYNRDILLEKHGRVSTYRNGKCKCSACTQANSNYQKLRYQQHSGLPAGDPRHGTINGYTNFRCTCALCRKANSDRTKRNEAAKRTSRAAASAQGGD